MALGEAEGGVAAGTEAEDITEVLKSERAGRRLPLKEDEITASAELWAEYVTADEVWSSLGDEDLFGVYADTFAQAIGKELPPIQMALAKKWWMDARPAPRKKEGCGGVVTTGGGGGGRRKSRDDRRGHELLGPEDKGDVQDRAFRDGGAAQGYGVHC